MLHAVVPKKRHRQNAEVATGWPRTSSGNRLSFLDGPRGDGDGESAGAAGTAGGVKIVPRLLFLSACRLLTVALKDAIAAVFEEASLSKQIGELGGRNETKRQVCQSSLLRGPD